MQDRRTERAEAPDVDVDQHDVVETVDRVVERRDVDTDLHAGARMQRRVVLQRELRARDDANTEILLCAALEKLRTARIAESNADLTARGSFGAEDLD